MSLIFELMYLIGFTPWDRDGEPAPWLRGFLDSPDAPKSGRALDLGCGLGSNALFLAEHGFRVTGVDAVSRALRVARKRAADRHLTLDFVKGDVTRLQALSTGAPFDLLLDLGCFHGMSDSERTRYCASVTSAAGTGALFLLFAFGPKTGKGAGPRGATPEDVERAFAGSWKVTASERDEKVTPPAGIPWANWYRLKRG
jgi:cyclopropane fatty-acyl-phospholipid synthase-like methyltransferase